MNLHRSVLLKEAIEALSLEPGDIYLDATLGTGGHAEEVFRRLPTVTILGIDLDETMMEIARQRLELLGAHPKLVVSNFRHLDKALQTLDSGVPTKILFDLGWNTVQFEEGERGFSFQKDEPLVMTFASTAKPEDTTAYDVVNSWQEENIADVIYAYGEERLSRQIAKAIVEAREEGPIKTSLQLAEIVKGAVPIWYKFGRIHPATRTFQALRIVVNDELQALEEGLKKALEALKVGGKIAVISFHSLEDRIVKNFFKLKEAEERLEIINKKPITATEEEIAENPRSRSAKMRIIKKTK